MVYEIFYENDKNFPKKKKKLKYVKKIRVQVKVGGTG